MIQGNCGQGCSISECVNAQHDFIALGNNTWEIDEEILDEQHLDKHFSSVGVTLPCRSDLPGDTSSETVQMSLPDPIKICRKTYYYSKFNLKTNKMCCNNVYDDRFGYHNVCLENVYDDRWGYHNVCLENILKTKIIWCPMDEGIQKHQSVKGTKCRQMNVHFPEYV